MLGCVGFMKEKWNGYIKLIFEVLIDFFIVMAGVIGCLVVTVFVGLARVGMENRYEQVMKRSSVDLQANWIWVGCSICFFLASVIFIVIAIKDKKKQIKGSSVLLVSSLVILVISVIFCVDGMMAIKERKEACEYIEANYTEESFNEDTKDMTEEEYEKFIESLNLKP